MSQGGQFFMSPDIAEGTDPTSNLLYVLCATYLRAPAHRCEFHFAHFFAAWRLDNLYSG